MPTRPRPTGRPINVIISREVADRARDVVYGTPSLTLSKLVEEALGDAIYIRELQRGTAFPRRPADALRSGRPAGEAKT